MILLDIKDLTINYANKQIINNLSLEIGPKEILCIVGESGIGKTTLLRAILNLIDYKGEIKKINSIGYMPQDLALLNDKSVYNNVILPLKIKEKDINEEEVEKVLKDLKIHQYKDTKVENISGGEKSRVALARSIINGDKLLLLDEPLSKLDNITKSHIIDLLKQNMYKYNMSYIYVTHDMEEVKLLADKLLVIKKDKHEYYEDIKNMALTT